MVRIGFKMKSYKQAVVNVTILVLILGLFVYLGAQFSQNFSVQVSTQRTQIITDTNYTYFNGYVFRDESVIKQDQSGVCDYLVQDGERVAVDKEYGVFYPLGIDVAEKQKELNELSERISRLNSKISAEGYVSELPGVEEELKKAYYAYINSVLGGDFSSADATGDRLVDSIVDRNVIIGKEGAAKDITAYLEAEKQNLILSLDADGEKLVSDESFYLSYSTDGYESVFTSEALKTVSPEDFKNLVSLSPKTYDDKVIGRAIHTSEWFLALPINREEAKDFMDESGNVKAGQSYEVTFPDEGDATVYMTLEEIRLSEGGEGFMVLSSYDMASSFKFSRTQNVKIQMGAVSGYRIPENSLVEQNQENGVYILIGTVVEFRRVNVKAERNGYYIVETYGEDLLRQEEAGEDGVEEIPYLNVNDLIITSGNALYDGKLID